MNIALLIEYDGSDYAGWQIQPNAVTVQEIVEGAILNVFGVSIPVVAAGRTDTGVHAKGQVAHFHVNAEAHSIPLEKIPAAINSRLPTNIHIRDAALVDEGFHARYTAVRREYVYLIAREQSVFLHHYSWFPGFDFNRDLLGEAARAFEGTNDFTTFSKFNPDTPNYTCQVHECRVEMQNERYLVRICADRFVYGMCRSIVGTMMAVARGKFSVSDIAHALESRDRSLQFALAPPEGLILNRIFYPSKLFEAHSAF